MNQNANNVQELGSDRPDEFLEDAKYFLKVIYRSTLKKGMRNSQLQMTGFVYKLVCLCQQAIS